jgi:two-component system sensor histidine kinase KdpD
MTEGEEARAKADALLAEVARERGGQLKVFLGAAPGVGKTYAMLNAARELRRQGIDVVVGLVETHGRRETEALLDGLPLLQRRSLAYKDRTLEEFDLDAALSRKPKVILVDELAHRNAPGSRHERRWQDIEELLEAGIDVYSTLNIQHLESLNDLVARTTGVPIRETVPDAFLDRARDVVLVDLPPRELIERLRQGKVYLPEQAASALESFFSPSNLTALRELAVQKVADRVDADLRDYLVAHGMVGTVGVRRRVLVAVDGSEHTEYLVRVGRRIAERRQAPLTVVWVDTGRAQDAEARRRIDQAFLLARRLGAQTELLRGINVADALLEFAGRAGVSTLVVGRTRERPLARMLNRTITQQLLRKGAHLELTIINTPEARAAARRNLAGNLPDPRQAARESAFAAVVVALACATAGVSERWAGIDDLSLVFMTAVVVVAVRSRQAVSMATAVALFLAYNFFFTDPRFSLAIASRQDLLTVAIFLAAAVLCGRLASRLRAQVQLLRAANAHTSALQESGRRLAAAADEAQVHTAAVDALSTAVGCEVTILSRRSGGAELSVAARSTGCTVLETIDLAAADWAAEHGQPAGRFTDTLAAATWWCVPARASGRTLAVAALRFAPATTGAPDRPTPDQERLVLAMLDDVAQALDRTRLVGDVEAARVQGETERLRAALLSSVSHDLRTPLASIIGAAESLSHYGHAVSADDRASLLRLVLDEGRRLDRYVQNLLDMTRLGHGTLKLDRDWCALEEIIGAAVVRMRRAFPAVAVRQSLDARPVVNVHPALIEQALFNILENAAKFSPPGASVQVATRLAEGAVEIDITDQGPGIPEADRQRIFDMFYSVARGDRGAQGTGLGLTICQGMIGAHGGHVAALPGPGGAGTTIRVTLPIAPEGTPPP